MMSAPDFASKQIIVAFLRDGEKVSFKNDNIIITDKDKYIKHQSSCYRLFSLFMVGHCTITSGLLERSKRFGFSIILFGHNMRVVGYWNARADGNILLRKKQYEYTAFDIAQHLVKNKIGNQICQLNNIRNKPEKTKINITKLQELHHRLPNEILDLHQILGIEGSAAKIYFQSMFDCVEWRGRKPRAKIDTINTLLDIGYTILFNFIEALLCLYGFDIYQGVYHRVFYQRKSLVCDMIEVFRPTVDYAIRKAYKLNRIKEEDFFIRDGRYYLLGKESQKYVKIFLQLIVENKQDMFLYIQSYYRAFMQSKPIDAYPEYISVC